MYYVGREQKDCGIAACFLPVFMSFVMLLCQKSLAVSGFVNGGTINEKAIE